jgi:molecular chaperone HtpG
LRYLTITDERYKALVGNGIESPRIDLVLDEANKTLAIQSGTVAWTCHSIITKPNHDKKLDSPLRKLILRFPW